MNVGGRGKGRKQTHGEERRGGPLLLYYLRQIPFYSRFRIPSQNGNIFFLPFPPGIKEEEKETDGTE